MTNLNGRTAIISGGSRGIGLEIAKRLAGEGANVAILAKTAEPHPDLPGTIYTAAEEIEAAGTETGAKALPILCDIRDDEAVSRGVAEAVERFGGIDLCINNASALNLSPMRDLPVKRFDLMQQVNARGTYVLTHACLPHLRESDHAHVLSLSPPFTDDTRWLANNAAYTLSKYGMTMITLGLAADEPTIAANCLWPRTAIQTSAVENLLGGEESMKRSRTPAIVADAALEILSGAPQARTGQALIDDEVLAEAGVTDLSVYAPAADPGDLLPDFFIDEVPVA